MTPQEATAIKSIFEPVISDIKNRIGIPSNDGYLITAEPDFNLTIDGKQIVASFGIQVSYRMELVTEATHSQPPEYDQVDLRLTSCVCSIDGSGDVLNEISIEQKAKIEYDLQGIFEECFES